MAHEQVSDTWERGSPYERYVGRWSREVAPLFLSWLDVAAMTNRSMAGSLNDLEFHCGIELEYHDDLRRVQRNLNDIPHVNREPCVPVDAVSQLFEHAFEGSSARAH